jgi:hypothetical protein
MGPIISGPGTLGVRVALVAGAVVPRAFAPPLSFCLGLTFTFHLYLSVPNDVRTARDLLTDNIERHGVKCHSVQGMNKFIITNGGHAQDVTLRDVEESKF